MNWNLAMRHLELKLSEKKTEQMLAAAQLTATTSHPVFAKQLHRNTDF